MEPNHNDHIRQKIRDAEGQPVPWNKEDVWNRINPRPAKETSRGWYYAAASLAALLVISIYAWVVYQENSFAIRMRGLELAIEKERSSSRNETLVADEGLDCDESTTSIMQAAVQTKSYPKFRLKAVAAKSIVESPSITEPVKVSEDPEVEAVVVDVTTAQPKVEPSPAEGTHAEFTPTVITIQPASTKPQVVVARDRKLKFHLFRKNERLDELTDNRNDDILFAQIH